MQLRIDLHSEFLHEKQGVDLSNNATRLQPCSGTKRGKGVRLHEEETPNTAGHIDGSGAEEP